MATPPLSPPPSIAVLPPDLLNVPLTTMEYETAPLIMHDPESDVVLPPFTGAILPESLAAALLPAAVNTPASVDVPDSDSLMTVASDPSPAGPLDLVSVPPITLLETLTHHLFDCIQDVHRNWSASVEECEAVGQNLLAFMHALCKTPGGDEYLTPFLKVVQIFLDCICSPGWLKWGMELLSKSHCKALMQELASVNSEPEEAPQSPQCRAHHLVHHSPTPFKEAIVKEIVDGLPTSSESVPENNEMVDADEPPDDG
ncbi:uncharacterized protein LAESUDRAFT_717442 [Laetiporus sulphureus 93-53]|uniref:Uncharacterized protein n=1 Tax=Laetiporus sulphureus 93-53 TaxID=1314785 RepID=A0A165BS98_9APHY|nr:uncharacterized protein LAESUDRAFT_717442 [Laetiporus sulphureus 93-53]KZT01560.1 hypothetical protein LAESUDRAFT_717442 [Laetiporus sulphureus 93-53]